MKFSFEFVPCYQSKNVQRHRVHRLFSESYTQTSNFLNFDEDFSGTPDGYKFEKEIV